MKTFKFIPHPVRRKRTGGIPLHRNPERKETTALKPWSFISNSEEETKKIASKLARGLKPNDCLALVGGFGSGKTTFVKGLADGLVLRKKNYVCSPSFVILKIYRARLPIYHFDLYRLHRAKDIEGIGLTEFAGSGGVTVVEWADQAKDYLGPGCLKVKFSVSGNDKRTMVFFPPTLRFRRLLKRLLA